MRLGRKLERHQTHVSSSALAVQQLPDFYYIPSHPISTDVEHTSMINLVVATNGVLTNSNFFHPRERRQNPLRLTAVPEHRLASPVRDERAGRFGRSDGDGAETCEPVGKRTAVGRVNSSGNAQKHLIIPRQTETTGYPHGGIPQGICKTTSFPGRIAFEKQLEIIQQCGEVRAWYHVRR